MGGGVWRQLGDHWNWHTSAGKHRLCFLELLRLIKLLLSVGLMRFFLEVFELFPRSLLEILVALHQLLIEVVKALLQREMQHAV